MIKNKQIHVTYTWDQWEVKQPSNSKASALADTKAEAIKIAERIAENQWLETKIHNKDWKISWWNSYWGDPFPPKDNN